MKRITLACALVGLGCMSQPTLAGIALNQFDTHYSEGEAAVRPQRDFPDSLLHQACRRVLTGPARLEVRDRLAEKMQLTLPEDTGFIVADITDYRSWIKDKWLHCTGTVTVKDWPQNLAGLAIRVAWYHADQNELEPLRPLLKLALEHSATTADAVALIAHLAPMEQQLNYLDANLKPEQLTMPASIKAVAEIWLQQKRWEEIIRLTERCDTLACRRLQLDAKEQKEIEDAEKVDDLSSYF